MSSMEPWPEATYDGPIPASNYSQATPVLPKLFLQVHHIDGPLEAGRAVFHNPASQASAHYGVDFDGSALWWVHPRLVAYAGCDANWTGAISVECANVTSEPDAPPTPQQIATLAAIANWHGIAPEAVTVMRGPGIGYHRQFPGPCSTHWGQTDCPGDGFVAAIPAIIDAMHGAPPPPTKRGRMVLYSTVDGTTTTYYRDAGGILVALTAAEAGAYYGAIAAGFITVVNLATAPAGAPVPAFLAALAFSVNTVKAKRAAEKLVPA